MAFGFPSLFSTPRFRSLRGIGYGVLGLLLLVLAAPFIVAKTPISTWLIAQATRNWPVNVTVGSLSLGWFTSLGAENVVVQDAEGNTLAHIPRVTVNRNLINLLASYKDFGKIRLERANLDIVFANNSSNIEEILRQMPKAAPTQATMPKRGAPPPATFAIEWVEGVIRIVDADKNKTWQLTKVEARLAHDPTAGPAMTSTVSASVTGDGESGLIEMKTDGDMAAIVRGVLTAKLQSIPAGIIGPLLRRSQPGLLCAGRLNGDFLSSWRLAQDGTPVFQLVAKIEGNDLEFSGGAFGDERVPVKNLKLPLKIEHTGTYLTFDSPETTCELGRATAKGRLTFDRSFLNSLGDPDTSLTVDLDLAKLAEAMPKTLKVHKDVRIATGRVKLEGKSISSPNGPLLDVKVVASDVRGMRGNTPITWLEPLNLTCKLRPSGKALPDLEEVYCKSLFMALEGKASAGRISVRGNVDLGQLTPKLGQFVDVDALGLAGRADLVLKMSWPDKNTVNIDADVNLDQFQWGLWREPQLTLKADVQVVAETNQQRIENTSTLRVTANADLLEVKLRDHVLFADQGYKGSLYITLDGDLGRWQQRLKPFIGFGDLAFQGQAKGQAWLSLKPQKYDVQSVVLSTKDLKLKGAGLNIQDPDAEFRATMAYSAEQGVIEINNSQIQAQGMVLYAPKLYVDLKRKSVVGNLIFGGDMGKLQTWFGSPVPEIDAWGGALAGKADLISKDDSFDIDVESTVKNFTLGPPKAPRYIEPVIQFRAKGNFAGKKDLLRFEDMSLTGKFGSVTAKANVAKFDATMELDVAGRFAYDLAAFEPMLKTYLGADARIQGKDQREFRFVGPMRPKGAKPGAAFEMASLQGNGGFSWQLINAYGADVGPADVRANLQGGWLKFDPITASLNQGNLRLAPSVRFDPQRELHLPAGPVVQSAKITPAMCASALGYALPLLANVASAEGEVSLRLDGARIPLGEPDKSELQGTIMLHHATVGPGPLVTEILGLLKATSPHSIIRENQVKVKLDKGRIYHENLELLFSDNFTVRTSGSVGLDGSLDMIAEMPVPPRLLGGLKLPAAIARTNIRLPITGTIDRPRIDASALKDVLGQAMRDAPADLIRQGIDSQLKKLFKPKN